MSMEPKCPRTRKAPGSKLGSTKSAPCAGTIRDPKGTGPACVICGYRFSVEEVAAIARARAHKTEKPRRLNAEQLSMLGDVV